MAKYKPSSSLAQTLLQKGREGSLSSVSKGLNPDEAGTTLGAFVLDVYCALGPRVV